MNQYRANDVTTVTAPNDEDTVIGIILDSGKFYRAIYFDGVYGPIDVAPLRNGEHECPADSVDIAIEYLIGYYNADTYCDSADGY